MDDLKNGTNRRVFLKQSMSGVLLLGASETFLSGCSVPAHLTKKFQNEKRFVLDPGELAVLESIAEAIIPVVEEGEPTVQEIGVASLVDEMISWRDEPIQAEFKQLLSIFDSGFVSLFFNGIPKRFVSCTAEQKEAVLRSWATSVLPIRRQGFMALKRLCNVAYWTDERTWSHCGYEGPMAYLKHDVAAPPATPTAPKNEELGEQAG